MLVPGARTEEDPRPSPALQFCFEFRPSSMWLEFFAYRDLVIHFRRKPLQEGGKLNRAHLGLWMVRCVASM